jgi:hypothetical protein
MRVYFSDWFDIAPELLEEYGAFNVSLFNDLPLFFMYTREKQDYRPLRDQMINYLPFLRDQAVQGGLDEGLLRSWYMFLAVKQLWLGSSIKGNRGSGLGIDFARALHASLNLIFKTSDP